MSQVPAPLEISTTGCLRVRGKKYFAYRLTGPHDDNHNGQADVRLSVYAWPLGQVLNKRTVDLPFDRLVDLFDGAKATVDALLPDSLRAAVSTALNIDLNDEDPDQ